MFAKLLWRYLWSGRFSTRLVSAFALAGTFLAAFALVFTLGVFNGFETTLKENLLRHSPHVRILVFSEEKLREVRSRVADLLGDEAVEVYPYAVYNLVLQKGSFVFAAPVYATDPSTLAEFAKGRLKFLRGRADAENCLWVGSLLAARLGLDSVPSAVVAVDPVARKTPVGFLPRAKVLKACAVYSAGYSALEDAALAPFDLLKDFNFSTLGVAVYLKDPYGAPGAASLLRRELKGALVTSWVDENAEFFAALRLQKLGMALVVGLLALLASFTTAALLFAKVREMRPDFAIFRAFGAGRSFVFGLVLGLGALIGLTGGGSGVAAALVAAELFTRYRLLEVPAEVYGTTYLPVLPGPAVAVGVFALVLLLSTAAALLPALSAAREPVSRILRND
ncbi:MAG: ABC transporter permease [Aquificae bacterium]|nr:ABC transporter permease [Aquificota bacterium]